MARVTSKRQLTIPKAIADRYGISSGDELELVPAAGDAFLVQRATQGRTVLDREKRLERFDQATARQQARQQTSRPPAPADRGWRREELYERPR